MFDDKMTELVAIGASVAANCHPCVKYHVSKAQEIGVNEEDINRADSRIVIDTNHRHIDHLWIQKQSEIVSDAHLKKKS